MTGRTFTPVTIICSILLLAASSGAAEFQSHAPMRPLPHPSHRALAAGPTFYADAARGDDASPGTAEKPWRTIAHALGLLKPGDTLCLHGGTYYEAVTLSVAGTAEKPITIRSHPGELAIIDGGFREFCEDPAHAWEPVEGGAEGEYRSTKAYPAGGNFGNFADSMIPLHRYINFADLRSKNEFASAALSDRSDDPNGIYCGPGSRRDATTGRIHIRLAHTQLAGLGDNAYVGETDPRKLPLVIAGADYALQLHNAHHVRIQDLVVRGGARGAVLITGGQDIELDGLSLYGAGMTMRTSKVDGLRVLNTALRGHAAPWGSRFHHKYRAHAGYLVLADGNHMEFANCELTDNHDFISLLGAYDVKFHHCFVENFNDDGFEPGPKRAHGQIFIYQNYVSRVLSPFTAHGKKPVPVEADPGSGVYIFRNIVDLRRGTYKSPPEKADPSGEYLDTPTGLVAHDHGSPVHPNYYVYQNTFLMQNVYRGYYDFTWGAHTRGTTRRVFNNLFVQIEGVPGLNVTGTSAQDDFQSDGNLTWGLRDGTKLVGDFFAKFRQSAVVASSKQHYPSGWSANDIFADPKFVALNVKAMWPLDVRLQKESPAIGAGVPLPAEWPDPLRGSSTGKPDIGAIPAGAEALSFGINGRIKMPFIAAPGKE
jgi:hypothetical protein